MVHTMLAAKSVGEFKLIAAECDIGTFHGKLQTPRV